MPPKAKRAPSWDFFLTAIGIFAAACAFAASLYLSRSIGLRLEKLQRENTVARTASVLQALDQDVHHLGDYTTGYAMWDDTYQFLETRDPAYLTTNYATPVMAVSPAQLVGIYDLHGSLVFAKALTEKRGEAPVPPGLEQWPRLEAFDRLKKAGEFQGRVEWLGGHPYLVAICPVTDSAGTAPIRGYLAFGTLIGGKVLDRLHTLTGVRVKTGNNGSPQKSDLEILTSDLGPAEVTILSPEGSENAEVEALFREDNSEQKSVIFQMALPAGTSRAGREISQTIGTVFLLVSAGFAVFAALAIRELWRRRAEIRGRILESEELVTARRRAEELAVSAEAADRAKSAFLAMMSHEIRTPLNAIIGYAQLLKSSPAEHSAERLDIICKSGGVLQQILDDILDFSKIEAGKLAIKRQAVAIRETIADVVGTFENLAHAKRILIFTEVCAEVPEFLMIDPIRFKQVLGNLVSNAVKFTEGGSVRIIASEASDRKTGISGEFRLRVCVEDEGSGVGVEAEGMLFQPFSQADNRRARRHEGTGLGLAICRRLCELMGGQVGFRRRTVKGSTFFFELPALPAATAAIAAPEPRSPQRIEKNLSVLVVDDNSVNARLLEAVLKRIGLESRIALSGRETLQLFEKGDFDVIFMDIQMPEMDGLETTAHVRQMERTLGRKPCLIIAVTADILMSDSAASFAAGMDGYLSKPINLRQIEEIFDRLLTGMPA